MAKSNAITPPITTQVKDGQAMKTRGDTTYQRNEPKRIPPVGKLSTLKRRA